MASSYSSVSPCPPSTSKASLLKITDTSTLLGVHPNTLRAMVEKGEFPCVLLPSGHRRFRLSDIRIWNGEDEAEEEKGNGGGVPIALVARVSSNAQSKGISKGSTSNDLSRQSERLEKWVSEKYGTTANVTRYTRTASGMNFSDPCFIRLINDILDKKFDGGFVVAVHPERIARFALRLIEQLCKRGGCELLFIGKGEEEKNNFESLSDDILAIMTHFSSKVYGARSAENRTKHFSPACLERMIELRQTNHTILDITRTLNREGFRCGAGEDEEKWNEKLTPFVVRKYLDSNGVEDTLTCLVNAKKKETPLEVFLRERVEKTENKADRIVPTVLWEAYREWCQSKGMGCESLLSFGHRLSSKGFRTIKNNGLRTIVGIKYLG